MKRGRVRGEREREGEGGGGEAWLDSVTYF